MPIDALSENTRAVTGFLQDSDGVDSWTICIYIYIYAHKYGEEACLNYTPMTETERETWTNYYAVVSLCGSVCDWARESTKNQQSLVIK